MDTPETLQQTVKRQGEEIDSLRKEFDLLKSSNSIPYEIEKSFRGRGFVTTDDFIISGQATLGVGGTAYIPMNVGLGAIAFGVYSDGTGSDIGAVILNNSVTFPNTMQLYLNGTGTKNVYYVVFKTANNNN